LSSVVLPAVGAEQADAVAALDRGAEIVHQGPPPWRTTGLGLDHLLAGAPASATASFTVAGLLAPLPALHAHRLERAHAAFVAGAARLDALPDPDFLLRQRLSNKALACASACRRSSRRRR
jgi:hypothetical protein